MGVFYLEGGQWCVAVACFEESTLNSEDQSLDKGGWTETREVKAAKAKYR